MRIKRESHVDQIVRLAHSDTTSPEVKEQVLWRLVDGIERRIVSMRRWMLVMIAGGVVFELIHRNQLSELVLFGLKARELTSAMYLAPVVISYGYAAQMSAWLEARAMTMILDAYGDDAFVDLRTSRILEALLPSFLWIGGGHHLLADGAARIPARVAGRIQSWLVTIGPFIFLTYAFVVLFGMRGANLAATVVALPATLVGLGIGFGFGDAIIRVERSSARRTDAAGA